MMVEDNFFPSGLPYRVCDRQGCGHVYPDHQHDEAGCVKCGCPLFTDAEERDFQRGLVQKLTEAEQARCTCVPLGGSYESYWGPHVDCPVHGEHSDGTKSSPYYVDVPVKVLVWASGSHHAWDIAVQRVNSFLEMGGYPNQVTLLGYRPSSVHVPLTSRPRKEDDD